MFTTIAYPSRAQRTNAQQAAGTTRKVEEIYANDHPNGKYTENIMDLTKYINVTNLLKDLGTEKFIIELNKDKTFFTVTAKEHNGCKVLATPDNVVTVNTPECIIVEVFGKLKLFSQLLVPLLLSVYLIFLLYRKKIFSAGFATVILLMLLIAFLCIVIPLFIP